MNHYHTGRTLAIAAGAFSALGAIGLLLADAIIHNAWTVEHVTVPLVVFLTIAAGHLMVSACYAKRPLSTFGFGLAFLLGTGIMVLNGIARQAEGQETKIMAAEHTNEAIEQNKADLEAADHSRSENERWRNVECQGAPAVLPIDLKKWPLCRKARGEVQATADRLDRLKAEETKLGAPKPVNAKGERAAQIAALFGFDHDRTKAAVTLLEPVALPFLLEWMSIVAFGFGFGHRRNPGNRDDARNSRATVTATIPATVANDDKPLPPKGGNHRTVASKAAAEADVIRLVARGEQLPSQDTLATRWGVHKGTVSKWITDFERRGLVARWQDGRRKVIAAA